MPTATRWAYRTTLLCGVLPLAAGVSVFLLWLVFWWDWLVDAGLLVIGGGCALFVVGIIVLAGCWVLARRLPALPRLQARRTITGAAFLLIFNFPAAGGIVAAVIAVLTCYTVVIENHSASALDAARVSGGGTEVVFGQIAAGEARRRWLWIRREGELTLRATCDGQPMEEIIDGYVTGGMGTRTVVTVEPHGTFSITNANKRFVETQPHPK